MLVLALVCKLNDGNIYILFNRLNKIIAGALDSKPFHLVNIILHCVVCSIFIVFVSIILGDGKSFTSRGSFVFRMPEVSTTSAVLFAVHPVHSESVSPIGFKPETYDAYNFTHLLSISVS